MNLKKLLIRVLDLKITRRLQQGKHFLNTFSNRALTCRDKNPKYGRTMRTSRFSAVMTTSLVAYNLLRKDFTTIYHASWVAIF